jgi:hypothetical protein
MQTSHGKLRASVAVTIIGGLLLAVVGLTRIPRERSVRSARRPCRGFHRKIFTCKTCPACWHFLPNLRAGCTAGA